MSTGKSSFNFNVNYHHRSFTCAYADVDFRVSANPTSTGVSIKSPVSGLPSIAMTPVPCVTVDDSHRSSLRSFLQQCFEVSV